MIIIQFFICYLSRKKYSNKLLKTNKIKVNFYDEISKFITYSQLLEDLILFCIFYDIKNGFYIDIGANDPNSRSVTKAFYLRGWKGINIEPLPDKYQALLLNRRRDINLKICAGKDKSKGTLYLQGGLSTMIKKYIRKKKFINIKINSMKNICRKYILNNQEIQFVKIDVEGAEREVLLGYDFENYRPKVFCIEATNPGTLVPSHHLWEFILLNNDYSFQYQYKVNRFYIDNRVKGLRERFAQVDSSIEKFKKIKLNKQLSNNFSRIKLSK